LRRIPPCLEYLRNEYTLFLVSSGTLEPPDTFPVPTVKY